MPLPSGFVCHRSLVGGRPELTHGIETVYEGLYDVDVDPPPETVLDIGANAGAFARWVLDKKWPTVTKLICYEPSSSTRKHLYQNLSPDTRNGQVEIHGKAVTTAPGPYVPLYDGATNTGERSLFLGPDQLGTCESVGVIHPKDLPAVDVIKSDCEGGEWALIAHYPHWKGVRAFMMEYHGVDQVPAAIDTLARAGLRLSKHIRNERMFIFKRD